MSLARCNPKQAAAQGKEMRLNIAGLNDRKLFFTVLGDDAPQIQIYCEDANARHFEENGFVERTPEQKDAFLEGKFAVQVIAVRTEMKDEARTVRGEIEVLDNEWCPAGPQLAKRLFEEDMRFVYEPIFAFGRNRANFLPNSAAA